MANVAARQIRPNLLCLFKYITSCGYWNGVDGVIFTAFGFWNIKYVHAETHMSTDCVNCIFHPIPLISVSTAQFVTCRAFILSAQPFLDGTLAFQSSVNSYWIYCVFAFKTVVKQQTQCVASHTKWWICVFPLWWRYLIDWKKESCRERKWSSEEKSTLAISLCCYQEKEEMEQAPLLFLPFKLLSW